MDEKNHCHEEGDQVSNRPRSTTPASNPTVLTNTSTTSIGVGADRNMNNSQQQQEGDPCYRPRWQEQAQEHQTPRTVQGILVDDWAKKYEEGEPRLIGATKCWPSSERQGELPLIKVPPSSAASTTAGAGASIPTCAANVCKKMTNSTGTNRIDTSTTRTLKRRKICTTAAIDSWSSCATSSSKVLEPSTHDVLKGRGEGLYNHEGNRFYRWIIKEKAYVYQTATRRKIKSGTISEIYLTIQKRGGRFLVLDEELNSWYEMSEVEAKKKISQSLRDEKKKRNVTLSKYDAYSDEKNTDNILNHEKLPASSSQSPRMENIMTTSQSRVQGEQQEELLLAYSCKLPSLMPVLLPPIESSSYSASTNITPLEIVWTHHTPSTCIDTSNNVKNTSASIKGNNVNHEIIFDPLLSPAVFNCYTNFTGGRSTTRTTTTNTNDEQDHYSSTSFVLAHQEEEDHPPLPTTSTKYLEEVEGLQPELRSLQPRTVENETGGMLKLELHLQSSAALKSEEDNEEIQEQQEGKSSSLLEIQNFPPILHENAAFSSFRSLESASNTNDQFVTDPQGLLHSSQDQEEEHDQKQEADDDDDDERIFSSFPSFTSSSPTFRQQEEHHDHQQQRIVRRHSLEEGSDDGFVIGEMVWEKDEY